MARNWDFQPGDGGEPDELARVLDWGVLLQQSRCDIVKRPFTTFSPTNGFASVGLYTPSLVDFEHWLNEKAPVSIPKQIELMERLSIAFKGRIHGFAPYDPWRQVDDEFNKRDETALDSVKRAVLEHGLIGVKLYPPMGFRAITNTELSVKDFPSHLGSKPYQSGFGAALDAALERLYAFCVENQVPVMAHAAPTQEASSGYGLRAHPKYWGEVLARPEYTKLHLNLAHFRGFSLAEEPNIDLTDKDDWYYNVGKILVECENAYADLAHYSDVVDKGCDAFRVNFIKFLGAFPEARKKILYGSDWSFIFRTSWHQQYLETIASWLIRNITNKPETEQIMGLNAVRVLGLEPGQPARLRLEAFYDQNAVDRPTWMNMIS